MTKRTLAVVLCVSGVVVGGGVAISAASGPPISEAFDLVGPPVKVGVMTRCPSLADLDGNGTLDVVVACGPCCGADPHPDAGHVQVLLNDGTGKLTPVGGRIRVGETSLGTDIGDINHDGIPDVVVHHHSSYDVAVLIGLGDGTFETPGTVQLHDGASPHVHSIRLVDVNHDDHLDVLATLVDDHALAVLLGDGAGGFAPALGQPYFAHRHPYAQLNVVDLNGDSHIDAVMTDMRGGGMTVLVGSGTGMFAASNGFLLEAHTPITTAERPMACSLGDIDGDGDLDAFAVFDESPLGVRMINTGNGVFIEPDDAGVELGEPSVGGQLVDVNGDGALDFVANTTTVKYIAVAPGKGDGRFGPPYLIPAHGVSPCVAAGDMNGDGVVDLVTGNSGSGTVSVLIQKN